MQEVSAHPGNCTISLGGHELHLRPDKTVWWPARRTLLVADLHLGKVTAFAAGGVPIDPAIGIRTADRDLATLHSAAASTAALRIIILGDLIHAKASHDAELLAHVAAWRSTTAHLEIVLIRGNHDTNAGDPPPSWNMNVCDEGRDEHGLVLLHVPRSQSSRRHQAPPSVCGHIHPVISLRDLPGCGGQRERVACFVRTNDQLILPAFGSFTGGGRITPAPDTSLYLIAGSRVLAV